MSFLSDSDVGVVKCSEYNLDVIADWIPPPPHSVNEEPDFVSLWEAQARALLLSSSLNFPGLAPHFDKIFFENFINDRKHPVPVEDLIELGIIPATRTASLPVYEETQDIDKQFSEYDVPHFGPCHDRPDPNEVPNFADPPSDSEGSGRHGHQRHDRRPPLRHFPAWVTDLWHLLQSDGATEHLEEGPVIYLGSYYVSHETCPRQNERRPIRLDRHYESWAQQIVQVWHDHFDHSRGFELHLVAPEPPIPVTHGIVGIILIVQHPVRGQEAVLTTTVYDALDGRHMTESAHSMPRLVEPSIVLERAGALARCRAVESQGFGPCYIRSGPHVFNRHQPLRCHDGLGLVIRIPELQPDDDDEIQTIEQLRREDRNAEPPGETDEVQMMARQPRLRESSTSPSTSSSDTTCSMASDSWQRTVIFAIDGSVRSLMLPQNDDHLMRSRIAAEFELEPHEIHNVFPVNERPDDLVEMELQGQLLQTIRDHRHPPIMRLLLVDIEVFIEQEILPFAFRRNTMWLPHTATRLTLLRLLGVESLCQHHEQGCRVWHNNDPVPPDTSLPLRLNDGDYVHIFIGNDDQMQCQNLGMDDFALLQTVPAAQLRTTDSHQRSMSLRRCSFHRRPVRRRQNHPDEDPDDDEQLRQLHDLWNRPERRHRGMQNEEVMLFETWYLCSMNHPRCSNPRTIALPHDPRLWPLRIAQVWRDRFRPHWAYRIIPIQPEPRHERHGGHLLIIQHEHPDEAGILMSQYRGSRDGQHHDRFAQLVPRLLTFDRYLWFQDHEILCAQDDLRCKGFHGNTPIPTQGAWPALTGQHLELYVTARSLDEDDVTMIQTSSNADAPAPGHHNDSKNPHFRFDVNAPPFEPEVDNTAMLQLHSLIERRQTAGQVAHTQRPPRQVLSLAACINPPPSVRVDFSHVFAIDDDLQHSFNYFLQEWPQDLPQPEVMSHAMESLVRCSGQLPFAYHFFTDGSRAAEGNVGAAIILLTQSIDGWHYGGCLYKRVVAGNNSAAGENGALTWALLWAISISNERWLSQRTIDIIYTFNFDSTSAGFVAAGYWKSRAHLNWRILQRSLAQILQTRHGLHRLHWNHIHAHAGHPWNEGADTLAKFATTTSEETNGSQCWEKWLNDADSLNALQWIWFKELMEAGDPRVPMLQDEYLISHLTAVQDWSACQQQPANLPIPPACPTESMRLDITIATANVLTLATACSRTSSVSRQLVLMKQFEEAHCHIIGIQETRHKHIVCQNNEYYHIYGFPATKEGQDGIQLWVSKRLPFGPHGEVIQPEHVRVVASASNYLVVKLRFAAWRCLIVTCRAPHSGRPLEEGRAFWANLTNVIQRKGAGLPLFFCGDANAHVGETVTDAIGSHFSAKENQAGSLFHNWLLQHGLYLPATFTESQKSEINHTFTAPDGSTTARIDYVALPQHLPFDLVEATVAPEIDIRNLRLDHHAVLCRFALHTVIAGEKTRQNRKFRPDVQDLRLNLQENSYFSHLHWTVEAPMWNVNPHDSAISLASSSQNALQMIAKPQSKWRRKTHISAATWELVDRKKILFKQLRALKRVELFTVLQACFIGWRQSKKATSSFRYILHDLPSWKCLHDKSTACTLHDYRLAASLAQEAIKQEDAKYYQAIADQAAQTHKVEGLQGLWKRLRAVQPKHRTKRQHQRRDIDVELQQHFETLEVGSSQPKQALLTACMHRNAQVQQLLDGPIQLQLCELPTLCEIEQHCLNQSPGKAPGPDGIPSDLCRYGAAAIAPQLHSVLCKAFLHGVEPATYKGGNLCAIFKGKGSEEDAGGYRGIILADSFAKISHAWARSRLLPTLQHRRTIGQLGGLPSQQTITAAQLVRLHNAVGQSKSLSTATLFIDLKAAFHHMIRELIFATRNNLLKTTLSSFLDENEFDIEQLHHDLEVLCQRQIDDIPVGLRRFLHDIHQHTWFCLHGSDKTEQGFCTATLRGTRPGSPLADIGFNLMLTDMLKSSMLLYWTPRHFVKVLRLWVLLCHQWHGWMTSQSRLRLLPRSNLYPCYKLLLRLSTGPSVHEASRWIWTKEKLRLS